MRAFNIINQTMPSDRLYEYNLDWFFKQFNEVQDYVYNAVDGLIEKKIESLQYNLLYHADNEGVSLKGVLDVE